MAHNQNYDIPEEEKMMNIEFHTTQDESFLKSGNDKFFFTRDVWYGEYDNKGKKAIKKQYQSCKTVSHFLDFYNDLPQEEKCFYELLKTDRPRKEYFDLDVKAPNPDIEDYTHYDSEEYFNLFCNLRRKFLEFKDIPYVEPDWRITDSSKPADPRNNKPKLLSLHCVNLNTTMINQEISSKYLEDFDYFLETHYPEYRGIFDVSVKGGNRNMRLIYSSKYEQNRPLLPAEWHEKSKNAPIIDFVISNVSDKDIKKAITTYNRTVRETNKNIKIQNKDEKKRIEFEENKFQPMSLINSDSENQLQEQIENLCGLIIETIKNQTSTLCDSKYPDKMNYENFRNLSFAYVNSIENIDEYYSYWFTDIYPIYRHSSEHNPKQIWNSIVKAKSGREKSYTIKSLHYWAKQHPEYTNQFKKQTKQYNTQSFDLNDNSYYWQHFYQELTSKIWDNYTQLQEYFINNFMRVCNVIIQESEHFYIKTINQPFERAVIVLKMFYFKKVFKENVKTGIDFLTLYEAERSHFKRFFNIKFQPYDVYSENVDIGHRVLNTFNGFKAKLLEETKVDFTPIQPIIEHLKVVWCNNDESKLKYILSWFAHIIKYPNQLNKTMVIIFSENQQVGKGIFGEWFIQNIIGTAISGKTSELENITGRFNSFVENKVFTILDDTSCFESYKSGAWNKLKSMITDELQTIENKCIDKKRVISNYNNYMMFTNQHGGAEIGRGDKRNVVFKCNDEMSGNREYFQHLSSCLTQENADIFFTYLYRLNGDDLIDPRNIPDTEERREMAKITMDQPRKFLLDIVEGNYEIGRNRRAIFQQQRNDESKEECKQYYTLTELWDEFNSWIYESGEKTGRYNQNKFRVCIQSSIQKVRVRLDETGQKTGNKRTNPLERYDIKTIQIK